MKMQNPSVTVSTVTCQAMTFVTTANTILAAATGVCFVLMKTCITTLASFLINLANVMKGEPMSDIKFMYQKAKQSLQIFLFGSKEKENSDEIKREMCKRAVQSNVCPHACDICAWNTLE